MYIRKATPQDIPAAFQLIRELAEYEKELHEVATNVEQMIKDGFGASPLYHLHIAEIDTTNQEKEIVGIALFYVGYSTWKGKMVYLDDLVVTQTSRRKGIGEALIQSVFDFAKEMEANQVRWHVLNWNEPAIRFYKKLQVKMEDHWITCKYGER